MKKSTLLAIFFFWSPILHAANLIQVYQDAEIGDPVYQQAIAQRCSDKESVPISLSSLLPSAGILATPSIAKFDSSGSATTGGNSSQKGYNVTLTLTQTIFNFANFANLSGAVAFSKQADATFNAASQDLMIRVARAYFAILEDEDTLAAIQSTKRAYSKQLDQVREQYKVGLKTITDVYTAEASYERAVSDEISAQTKLTNDHENLRVITGKGYGDLDDLSERFPLISPCPANMEDWVAIAVQQNWNIKAAQHAVDSSRANIKQQFAGHLPTLNAQGIYNVTYTRTMGSTGVVAVPGSSRIKEKEALLNLNIPLVQGGLVLAQTRQAKDNFQIAAQKLEKTMRDTVNTTRQSYLGVIAGISKIKADKQAIKSSASALEGMEAGYSVGTETLVNVLNQQQKVFEAKKQYAIDRYAYVNNLLALKQATGTLSPEDLMAINAWLIIG